MVLKSDIYGISTALQDVALMTQRAFSWVELEIRRPQHRRVFFDFLLLFASLPPLTALWPEPRLPLRSNFRSSLARLLPYFCFMEKIGVRSRIERGTNGHLTMVQKSDFGTSFWDITFLQP